LFLASSLSNHVTGEIVFVTGGYEWWTKKRKHLKK
jgi:enoyl-[acyl-carrier-protein] reductase (NADH)